MMVGRKELRPRLLGVLSLTAVILSEAKDIAHRWARFFASLRMTIRRY
jgi:hypothetical protein